MKRFLSGIWITILPLLFLLGCGKTQNRLATTLNLTEKIGINCQFRQNQFIRMYTDPDKIDVILLYLHRLPLKTQFSESLTSGESDQCEITLHLSNGTTRKYILQGKHLLQNFSGEWYGVEQENANIFYHLISHIESDEPSVSQFSRYTRLNFTM